MADNLPVNQKKLSAIKKQMEEAVIKIADDNGLTIAPNLPPFAKVRIDYSGDGRVLADVSVSLFNLKGSDKPKNCPNCKHWCFTRTSYWCTIPKNPSNPSIPKHPITYTSMDIGSHSSEKCEDYDPIRGN